MSEENKETPQQRKKIEHVPIYQSDVEQINFLDKRFYTNDGGKTYLPSVTSVLGCYPKGKEFQEWLKELGKNADAVVEQAGREGSMVHEAIEDFLAGVVIDWKDKNYPLIVWSMFLRFVDFYYTWNPEIEHIERKFFSKKIGAAGTCDLICKIDGKRYIIDHKTSNAIHHSYKIQGLVYKEMYEEEFKEEVEGIGILWLKASTRGRATEKTGNIQGKGWQLKLIPKEEWADLKKDWKSCLQLYKSSNPPKPYNKIYPSRIDADIYKKEDFIKLMRMNGFDIGKRFK